jgi:DNA-binding Xre family transcriptional regulator
MAQFNKNYLESFIATMRKYMSLRNNMTQKDLCEQTKIGVSTMSRFITMKTQEIDPQMIAMIVAKLNIPLHEMIEFVDQTYTDEFLRLVKFFKEDKTGLPVQGLTDLPLSAGDTINAVEIIARKKLEETEKKKEEPVVTTEKKEVAPAKELTLVEKIEKLSPRQRAFVLDFLKLDMESKDVIVDIGNSLLRYFDQKGIS